MHGPLMLLPSEDRRLLGNMFAVIIGLLLFIRMTSFALNCAEAGEQTKEMVAMTMVDMTTFVTVDREAVRHLGILHPPRW